INGTAATIVATRMTRTLRFSLKLRPRYPSPNDSNPPTKYNKKMTVEILFRKGKGGTANRPGPLSARKTTTPERGALNRNAGKKLYHSNRGNLCRSGERRGKLNVNRRKRGAEKAEIIEPATNKTSSHVDG